MDMSLSKLQELVMDREVCVLQSMGSQRVGHDWATEVNWTEHTKLFLVVQLVKNLPAMQETPVWFLGQDDPPEKG